MSAHAADMLCEAHRLLSTGVMSAENYRKPRKIAVFAGVVLVAIQFACVLNAAQPTLTQPAWSGSQFQFTLRGETNVGYLIEASTNLVGWEKIGVATHPQSGEFEFEDRSVSPYRFYRVTVP